MLFLRVFSTPAGCEAEAKENPRVALNGRVCSENYSMIRLFCQLFPPFPFKAKYLITIAAEYSLAVSLLSSRGVNFQKLG